MQVYRLQAKPEVLQLDDIMAEDLRIVLTLRFGKVSPAKQQSWDHNFRASYEVQQAHILFVLFVGSQVTPSHILGQP